MLGPNLMHVFTFMARSKNITYFLMLLCLDFIFTIIITTIITIITIIITIIYPVAFGSRSFVTSILMVTLLSQGN